MTKFEQTFSFLKNLISNYIKYFFNFGFCDIINQNSA